MLTAASSTAGALRKGALCPLRRRLLELMQRINFGRVQFIVRDGQPDFTQPVLTVRTVKPASGENKPRPEARRTDFELRKEVMVLLDHVARASDGASVMVKVQHGLPVLIEIEQEHTA